MGQTRATPKRGRSLTKAEFADFKSMAMDLRIAHKKTWAEIAEAAGYKSTTGVKGGLQRGSISLYYYERMKDYHERMKGRRSDTSVAFEVPEPEVVEPEVEVAAETNGQTPDTPTIPVVPVAEAATADPFKWMDDMRVVLENMASECERRGLQTPKAFRQPYKDYATLLLELATAFERGANGD